MVLFFINDFMRSSEVRIRGGRIIGAGVQPTQSRVGNIGVYITGNNGGVHLETTDVISHHEGIRMEDTGAGSNRFVSVLRFFNVQTS